ncbi:TnsA-like heteromeric transposase endonuclease subunit [Salinispora sp. H7-4]|uniref:TnsA-like heteromeric transposase endonuclease subunit n=1 Tax=Salinispora sp. H7-4 TaxID=2748321 RepID=UPI0028165608|nr:TnsA-like heteromeric transposase endonuclease subunit [Salinispora sp. H7-4]
MPFERLSPVRSFPSYWGQRNYPGCYWSASSGRHVGYESWLERDEAMAMDFDPTVVAFAAQPFWLFWPEGSGVRSHPPDFFARKADGTGVMSVAEPLDGG